MNKLIPAISFLFPFSLLKRTCSIKSIFPLYHVVSDDPPKHVKQLYTIKNIKEFRKDLDFFLKHYKPIDLHEVIKLVENDNIFEKKIFHLTFDDGLSEIYNVIAPILKEKGIPATYFVNSAFIDNKDLFYRYKISILVDALKNQKPDKKYLNEIAHLLSASSNYINNVGSMIHKIYSVPYQKKDILNQIAPILNVDFQEFSKQETPYLTSEQINLLIKDGFTIGAHSIDHPRYRTIPIQEQISQTKQSIDFIQNKFNLNYRAFAFPFSDYGVKAEFFEKINNEKMADITFGSAGLKKDFPKKNIQRVPVEKLNIGANKYIRGEYLYYLLKSFFEKNKIIRK